MGSGFRNISGLPTSDVYEKLSKGFEMSCRYYNMSCEDDQGFFIVHMLSSHPRVSDLAILRK
uniref:hypothetical protein n=1 Tax=Proteus mirabilis TaxID=584 RepID=UPI001953A213